MIFQLNRFRYNNLISVPYKKLCLTLGVSLLISCSSMPSSFSPEANVREQVRLAETTAANLDNSLVEISGYEQIQYQPLLQGRKSKYLHDHLLQAFSFNGSKSFVKGFERLGEGQLSSVSLRSFVWRPERFGGAKKSIMLFPSFMILDEQFEILEDFSREKFRYQSKSPYAESIAATVTVPAHARNGRYLLIYVAQENKRGTLRFCRKGNGIISFTRYDLPQYQDTGCYSVPFGVEGRIEVQMH